MPVTPPPVIPTAVVTSWSTLRRGDRVFYVDHNDCPHPAVVAFLSRRGPSVRIQKTGATTYHYRPVPMPLAAFGGRRL